jgi:hypothetical protein
MKYEFVNEDFELVQNEFTGQYEWGHQKDLSYSPNLMKYSKKGKKLVEKWNNFTNKYEFVPEDWVLRQNPFTGKYEYAPKD